MNASPDTDRLWALLTGSSSVVLHWPAVAEVFSDCNYDPGEYYVLGKHRYLKIDDGGYILNADKLQHYCNVYFRELNPLNPILDEAATRALVKRFKYTSDDRQSLCNSSEPARVPRECDPSSTRIWLLAALAENHISYQESSVVSYQQALSSTLPDARHRIAPGAEFFQVGMQMSGINVPDIVGAQINLLAALYMGMLGRIKECASFVFNAGKSCEYLCSKPDKASSADPILKMLCSTQVELENHIPAEAYMWRNTLEQTSLLVAQDFEPAVHCSWRRALLPMYKLFTASGSTVGDLCYVLESMVADNACLGLRYSDGVDHASARSKMLFHRCAVTRPFLEYVLHEHDACYLWRMSWSLNSKTEKVLLAAIGMFQKSRRIELARKHIEFALMSLEDLKDQTLWPIMRACTHHVFTSMLTLAATYLHTPCREAVNFPTARFFEASRHAVVLLHSSAQTSVTSAAEFHMMRKFLLKRDRWNL